jgi:pimeloyl-ACP methyl ester carboxylesterase
MRGSLAHYVGPSSVPARTYAALLRTVAAPRLGAHLRPPPPVPESTKGPGGNAARILCPARIAHMISGPEGETVRRCISSITPSDGRLPHRASLLTDDGVRIEAAYEPWTGLAHAASADDPEPVMEGSEAHDLAIVVAHGFTGSLDRPAVQRVARTFARHTAVITFSFRGHGGSGGRSTVGDREVLDLAAAVRWARSLGHTRVATVGFSMGGSVVVRHAALYRANGQRPDAAVAAGKRRGGNPQARTEERLPDWAYQEPAPDPALSGNGHRVQDLAVPAGGDAPRGVPPEMAYEGHTDAHADAVVAVSAPARWYYRGTAPMRRLHWIVTRPLGRLVGRYGLRTRIHPEEWDPMPLSPVAAVPLIAPTPLLIVHGDRDPYFPLDHPQSLAEAAKGAAELWIENGLGHAENAVRPELLHRIAGWVVAEA